MNKEYFYGIQQQIREAHNEPHFKAVTTTVVEINRNPEEEIIRDDYEIVVNEEEYDELDGTTVEAIDCIETATIPNEVQCVNVNSNANSNANTKTDVKGNTDKLQLSLSAEQIALKSQITKIDKSIKSGTETDMEIRALCKTNEIRKQPRNSIIKSSTPVTSTITATKSKTLFQPQTRASKREQNGATSTPINFTILPLGLATRRANNKESANNLPEIVLTSFEARSATDNNATTTTTMTTSTNVKAMENKSMRATTKSTSVTFQRPLNTSALSRTVSPSTPQLQITKFPPLPPPPPPPFALTSAEAQRQHRLSLVACNQNNNINNISNNKSRAIDNRKQLQRFNDSNAEAVIVVERSDDTATEDSSISANTSVNNSLIGGNSTSPESLMDNILSGASSVSVQSSTSSTNSNGNGNIKLIEISSGTIIGTASNTPTNSANITKAIPINRPLNSFSEQQMMLVPSPLSPGSYLQSANSSTTINSLASQLQLMPPHPISSQSAEHFDAHSNRSRSPSPSHSMYGRVLPDSILFPEDLKCHICNEVLRDPRTLNCLHSFCFQCLVDENFKQDSSIPFWSQPNATDDNDWKAGVKSNYSLKSSSPETSPRSGSESAISPLRQRRPSFSFIRKKSLDKILKAKSDGKGSEYASSVRLNTTTGADDRERQRVIQCKTCNYMTELPIGGIRQLPQNFMLIRKIENLKLQVTDELLTQVWCNLCFEETNAAYHCVTCSLNICTLCKESHERQRSTANHNVKNLLELRRERKQRQNVQAENSKFILKCGMHPGFEMKAFCHNCLQVACADCLVLLHKGHKHEPIAKAITSYGKILRDSMDQTRPLCSYAEHSIERLNEIAKSINRKCDEIQKEVDTFMNKYFEALEVHRKTLTMQVQRARQSKVDMILDQQIDLGKRTNEAMDAVRFSQDLTELASDVEVLSFLNILLKRFDYCQQFKSPVDPKISDSLHFLKNIRAPFAKSQNGIPLFGIITMQTVDPSLCMLQWDGFSQLRLHKKVELLLLTRDADGVPLCHGGIEINVLVKYKDQNAKFLTVDISDHRDGTYGVAFTPDSQGTLLLTVTINDKPIKGSPYTFPVRTVRPHSGIFHCCAFCSSKGNKQATCCCEGRMPGYAGCGHGHAGHPGRRHWSCCGNVLENSECSAANKLLNA